MRGMSSRSCSVTATHCTNKSHERHHVLEKTRTQITSETTLIRDSAQITRLVIFVLIEIGTDVLLAVTVTLQSGGLVIETLWI